MCRKTASITSNDFPQFPPYIKSRNPKPLRGKTKTTTFFLRFDFKSPRSRIERDTLSLKFISEFFKYTQ